MACHEGKATQNSPVTTFASLACRAAQISPYESMVRGTAPAEAAWINDASARSSCGTECAALERARTAPELLFPGWPSNGAHCPPVPPAQDNPYRGAAARSPK